MSWFLTVYFICLVGWWVDSSPREDLYNLEEETMEQRVGVTVPSPRAGSGGDGDDDDDGDGGALMTDPSPAADIAERRRQVTFAPCCVACLRRV